MKKLIFITVFWLPYFVFSMETFELEQLHNRKINSIIAPNKTASKLSVLSQIQMFQVQPEQVRRQPTINTQEPTEGIIWTYLDCGLGVAVALGGALLSSISAH